MIKVCKFGGTSMADGMTMRRVKDIFESDPERRYIVVSAPGKRFSGDIKVTDLLYETQKRWRRRAAAARRSKRSAPVFRASCRSSRSISTSRVSCRRRKRRSKRKSLPTLRRPAGSTFRAASWRRSSISPSSTRATSSRFRCFGKLESARSFELLARALSGKPKALVTGFYGEGADGKVKTFSRGGSDISGAIVARAAGAALYENWTDVSGFLACDPRIVENPGAHPLALL